MPIKTWLGKAYVVLSEKQAVRSLRQVPLFGMVIHGISHLCLPWSTRTWVEVEAGVGNGLRMLLNPRYDRGFWHGDYEPNIQEVFMKHIKPGAVVYDIGANIGFFAMVAARLVGPLGQVFAFEADPDNASRLRENRNANCLDRISVVTSPVWSSSERVFFARCSDHSSLFVGSVQSPGSDVEGFYEQAITLDEFARDHALPDFIKMDIEGGETKALAGASEVFRKARPLLLLEVHNRDAEVYVKRWLEQYAYGHEWLAPGPTHLPCHMIACPNAKINA